MIDILKSAFKYSCIILPISVLLPYQPEGIIIYIIFLLMLFISFELARRKKKISKYIPLIVFIPFVYSLTVVAHAFYILYILRCTNKTCGSTSLNFIIGLIIALPLTGLTGLFIFNLLSKKIDQLINTV